MSRSTPTDVFGERLRRARELRDLNQAELAVRAGFQPSAISHFETGARKPSFDNLLTLAKSLDVTTDYLLGRVDDFNGLSTGELYRNVSALSAADRDFVTDVLRSLAERRNREDR